MTATTVLQRGSVKICSLREVEHAQFVLDAGADLFGLIFAPARRQVTLERAKEIVDAVRESAAGVRPLAVGVFVDAPADEINRKIAAVGLDLVQLHGNEPPELLAMIDAPALKAFRPAPGSDVDVVRRGLERYAASEKPLVGYLIDGFDPAQHGGQGVRADWQLVAQLAVDWPVVLAGGLNPENVAGAIDAVGPVGVDVSSGVETGGVKDRAKIVEFVRQARAGFAARAGRVSVR